MTPMPLDPETNRPDLGPTGPDHPAGAPAANLVPAATAFSREALPLEPAKPSPEALKSFTPKPFGAIAEWAGLHYKKNFDAESTASKLELIDRYLSMHRGLDETFGGITLEKGNVRLVLENIGEGVSGDYDPEDEMDEPLARFTVYVQVKEDYPEGEEGPDERWLDGPDEDGWCAMADGSYCTNIDLRLPDEDLRAIAQYLLDQVAERASRGQSIKRLCETLSHTSHEVLL